MQVLLEVVFVQKLELESGEILIELIAVVFGKFIEILLKYPVANNIREFKKVIGEAGKEAATTFSQNVKKLFSHRRDWIAVHY